MIVVPRLSAVQETFLKVLESFPRLYFSVVGFRNCFKLLPRKTPKLPGYRFIIEAFQITNSREFYCEAFKANKGRKHVSSALSFDTLEFMYKCL